MSRTYLTAQKPDLKTESKNGLGGNRDYYDFQTSSSLVQKSLLYHQEHWNKIDIMFVASTKTIILYRVFQHPANYIRQNETDK